jgi:hypothetical protein
MRGMNKYSFYGTAPILKTRLLGICPQKLRWRKRRRFPTPKRRGDAYSTLKLKILTRIAGVEDDMRV